MDLLGHRLSKRARSRVVANAANECWLWTGCVSKEGYGVTGRGPGNVYSKYVHRRMWQETNGSIPADREIDHLCRVRNCVNPLHMELVTRQENVARGTQGQYQSRKTHCPQGHAYTEDNVKTDKRGCRGCKACARESWRLKNWGHR